ncbi:MAG: aldehyde reductase [Pseudomonadota bacterium]
MARKKQVLVTGGSGFIAKHIILALLDEGLSVRASVRNEDRAADVRAAMNTHARDRETLDARLTFVELDLTRDEGWDAALDGCSALIHTASPFPMAQPEDEDELVRPAVDGTLRAMNAARDAGVTRVILTSSTVAVTGTRLPAGRHRYDENDWTDVHSAMTTPYAKSKTLAERAAWSFVREHPEMKLTSINPGLVLGPPLDSRIGTSLELIERLLAGKDPLVPRLGLPVVDVRDIAQMHVRALLRDESVGFRFVGAERFMWMTDLAKVLAAEYPDRRVPTRQAPDWLLRLFAIWDKSIKGILPTLGHETPVNSALAAEILGIEFIEARQAIRTSAASLFREGHVS